MQGYDFVELNRRYGCVLQMGGSDQWGNIINGVDLSHRMGGPQLYALTTPLLTTASGAEDGQDRLRRRLAQRRSLLALRFLAVLPEHRGRRRRQVPQDLHPPAARARSPGSTRWAARSSTRPRRSSRPKSPPSSMAARPPSRRRRRPRQRSRAARSICRCRRSRCRAPTSRPASASSRRSCSPGSPPRTARRAGTSSRGAVRVNDAAGQRRAADADGGDAAARGRHQALARARRSTRC